MTSATQTIEATDGFLLNCLPDVEFSSFVDFGTDLEDLIPATELNLDFWLPLQSADEEVPAESHLMKISPDLTEPDSGLVDSTAEQPLAPLVETCAEVGTDTGGQAVCEPKSATKADCQIEV